MLLSYEHSKLRISYLEQELSNLPAGKIVVCRSHGYEYKAVRLFGSKCCYSLNRPRGQELLPLIERAESIKKELLSIQIELERIRQSERQTSFIKRRNEPVVLNKALFDELKKHADSNPYKKPANSIEYKGILMRSKGEVMIAQKLDFLGIEYIYETRLWVGRAIFPDFTIYLPEIDKVAFIEFMGALSDPNYLPSAGERFRTYAGNAYILGRDFIFICETSDVPTDLDMLVTQLNALVMANTETVSDS